MKQLKDAKAIAHTFQNGFREKKYCIEKAIEYNKKYKQ